MSLVNSIRELKKRGMSISEIQRMTGHDPKTIKKYLEQDDFSPTIPVVVRRSSKLDPFKPIIDAILEDDQKQWHKQRHTAKRIYERLRDDYGFDGSYQMVQRYKREKDAEMKKAAAFQDLVWDPATAQVDFGQADFLENGNTVRKHYLTASFPYSNVSFTQVFNGETSECVCQGLQDIFHHIGAVPRTIVFDNATGIGRRIGENLKLSELFEKFNAHYGFSVRFCNPHAGHEKGNVENHIGTTRRNLFVPIPTLVDEESFNEALLPKCWDLCDKVHYKKQVDQHTLFEDDLKAMDDLPVKPFDAFRSELHKTDKKGIVKVDGCHYYSTRTELVREEVIVLLKAHHVEILRRNGEFVARHRRMFGDKRTDTLDPGSTLSDLRKKPGAWENSQVRAGVEEPLRDWMDAMDKSNRKQALNAWHKTNDAYDFEVSKQVMGWFAEENRMPSEYDALSVAQRIVDFGLTTPPDIGPSLAAYDVKFLHSARKAGADA